MITENGSIELNIPRDREGKFAPVIVSKNQTRIDGLDQKIISLYAKGMSLSDIKIQLHELYGAEVSESLISRLTDDIIDEVRIWQSRPLEACKSQDLILQTVINFISACQLSFDCQICN